MADKKKTLFSELQKKFLTASESDRLSALSADQAESTPDVLDLPVFDFDSAEPEAALIVAGGASATSGGGTSGAAGAVGAGATATGATAAAATAMGGAAAATAAASKTSDRRLKMNISPLSSAESLAKTLRLQGVEYDWRDKEKLGSQHQIGLIAQELEAIFPEVVHTNPVTGLKSVSYQLLVAPMIESIKELHARLARLEGELELKNSLLRAAEEKLENTRPPLSS